MAGSWRAINYYLVLQSCSFAPILPKARQIFLAQQLNPSRGKQNLLRKESRRALSLLQSVMGNGYFSRRCAESFCWDTSVPIPTLPAEPVPRSMVPVVGTGTISLTMIWGTPISSGKWKAGGWESPARWQVWGREPQVAPEGFKPQKVKEHIGAEPQLPCMRDALYLPQCLPWILLVLNKPQALVQPALTKIRVVKHKSLQKQDSDLSKQPILDGPFSEGPC